MKAIEVSKLQAIIEASTKEAQTCRGDGRFGATEQALGIESVVKALEELIEAEK